jgi:hypothetical protein
MLGMAGQRILGMELLRWFALGGGAAWGWIYIIYIRARDMDAAKVLWKKAAGASLHVNTIME